MSQGGNSGDDRKWLGFGMGLKAEIAVFKEALDVGCEREVKENPKVLVCTAGGAELAPCGIGTVREGGESIMIRGLVWEMFILRHLLTVGCWVILFSFLCHSELRPHGSQLYNNCQVKPGQWFT